MTREEFYQNIEKFIMGMLPEEYANMTPVVRKVVNQGGSYMGLFLQCEETKDMDYIKDETFRIVEDYAYAKTKLFIAPASLVRQTEGDVQPCMKYADLSVQVRIFLHETWQKTVRI